MNRVDTNGDGEKPRRRARATRAKSRRLADRLRELATEILRQIPDGESRSNNRRKEVSAYATDQSPRKGYQWPASALTEDDMRKLHDLREQTNAPIALLLHEAVSAFHALTTGNPEMLEQIRHRTGCSLGELLGEAVSLLAKRHGVSVDQLPEDDVISSLEDSA